LRGGRFGKAPSKKARKVLEKFAETSGGRAYFPISIDGIGELCKHIARDLRNHYTLGYTPSNRKLDGSWRKVAVRLNPPKGISEVTVRTKEGYYAPNAQAVTER
jgi:Ca-activated chloride channel family protein